MPPTHVVENQPPPLVDYDLYAADPLLPGLVERHAPGADHARMSEFGRVVGSAEVIEWGFLANRHPPLLHTHDRYGHRVDRVDFHPAWHRLLDLAVGTGLHSLPWEGGAHGFVERAALTFLSSQIEAGHWCPISMTTSAVPALRIQPELAAEWEPRLLSRSYDPSFLPADKKTGILMGMGMTEKQGGSDVRSNSSVAQPVNGGGPGTEYLLTGHKWFTSAPMNDAFLVLAQAPGGFSCFLMPRFTADGERNNLFIQRLKDKLGNRSNASAEIEFDRAWGTLVGEEGRGVATILEMVNVTRLDCVTGSAAMMRQAVSQAAHHAAHRSAFGSMLIDKPLMRNVIADLEVETQAAQTLMMRTAAAFDGAGSDPHEAMLRRILTPVAKYWVTKRCTGVVHEALECLGGNGYVEESIMPRLLRESPLNAIWEGSGNVIALDVVRALQTHPETIEVFLAELGNTRGAHRSLDDAVDTIAGELTGGGGDVEGGARRLVGSMAAAMAASLLVRSAQPGVAEAFIATRVAGDGGHLYGTLPAGVDTGALASRAVPR
ncbi:MAG: acyl-CoA dehydrogenase family protein [Acidimicrobiia bacterium]